MKTNIDPGRDRKSINFLDNIVYSRQKDLDGNSMELKMSIMVQNGNSEMRLAAGIDTEKSRKKKPAILWIPGGGYRGCDKNLMVAEMMFLADAGYAVASMYYRSSAEGHFPVQMIDVATAVRFLRAHADKYDIDPEHIGVIGRSAGGHLAAMAAMNSGLYESSEWEGYSSNVQACCDMFGPVDVMRLIKYEADRIKNDPDYRWKSIEESHPGALLGGDPDTMVERAKPASASHMITQQMCPTLILHGDSDPLVPCEISEDFYQKLVDSGLGGQTDFYIVKNAGHGTDEFFQESVKEIILHFFNENLLFH